MEIKSIETGKISPHPNNPRLVYREDVVSAIMAGIENGFHPSHALQVKTQNGGYVVLSGHQRLEAAKRAGIDSVPCWVRDDLDDNQAFMLLATDNNQGELSPLEIGIHALNYVGKASGGRGKTGGLSEYARAVGKTQQAVSLNKQAAEVAVKIPTSQLVGLLGKAAHLAAIHALPEGTWPAAVETMLKGGWSAKETQEKVSAAKAGGTDKRIVALLSGKTSARELARIDELRAAVEKILSHEEPRAEWIEWFNERDPIDIKEVQAMRIKVEDADAALTEKEQPAAPAPEYPNLVLADPPWRYDFSETDSRQIENQYPSATVEEIISHCPRTESDCVLFLWATVAKLREALEVMDGWGFEYKTCAVWDKQKIGMGYWFRGQHEILLVGTKGKVSPPDTENRVSSLFSEERKGHSEKPECVYSWLEKAFPENKKLEMYCRKNRDGWLSWGNEV